MSTPENIRVEKAASAASCGVIIGHIKLLSCATTPRIEKQQLLVDDIGTEQSRLHHATAMIIDELNGEITQLLASEHHEILGILEAHKLLLQDEEFTGAIHTRISTEKVNAEWAIHLQLEEIKAMFSSFEDEYLRDRFQDILHVGQRLLQKLDSHASILSDHSHIETQCEDQSSVFVAKDMSPAHVIMLWRMGAAGLIVEQGGANAHSVIVARGIGLPMLMGVPELLAHLHHNDAIILDAEQQRLIVHPNDNDIAEYRRFIAALNIVKHDLHTFAEKISLSKNKRAMPLMANAEFTEEMAAVKACGAEGIGLFRTEFTFLRDPTPPDESRQYLQYCEIMRQMEGYPCTFRLLDIGSDKPALFQQLTGYEEQSHNPALGLRGVRLLLAHPEVLKTQLRALLRASLHGDLRVMIPMVNWREEVERVRSYMLECARELAIDQLPALGCMIETPAAVMIADTLASVSDFFSIGSNDLIQYALAADRENENSEHHCSTEHPAIRALIKMTCQSARQAGIPVSVCGELAGNTEWTNFFLNIGVSSLSMAPQKILTSRSLLARLIYEPE